jgi:hypothetical protein
VKTLLAVISATVFGFAVCFFWPALANKLLTYDRTEEARATSPDQRFDAVVLRESYGGAAGGIEWFVFIVPKGKSPTFGWSRFNSFILEAATVSGLRLSWRGASLLEIGYERASIEYFRNTEFTGRADPIIEIRLARDSIQ